MTVSVPPKIFASRPPQFHTCTCHFICHIASSKTHGIQVAKCSEISISRYFIVHPDTGVELDHSIFQVICILQGPPCISYPETGIFAAEQELKCLQIRVALNKAQPLHSFHKSNGIGSSKEANLGIIQDTSSFFLFLNHPSIY